MTSAITLEDHVRSHEDSLLKFYTDFLNRYFDKHANNGQDKKVFVYVKQAKKCLENVQLSLNQYDPSTSLINNNDRDIYDNTVIPGNSCTDLKSTSSCQSNPRSTVKVQDRQDIFEEESFTQGNSNEDQAIMVMNNGKSASMKDDLLPPKLLETSYDNSSAKKTILTKDSSTQVTTKKKKDSSLSKKLKRAKMSVTSFASSFRGEVKKVLSSASLTPSQWHLAGPVVDNVDIDSVTNLPANNSQSKMFTSAEITEKDDSLSFTSLNDNCLTVGEMFQNVIHQHNINDNQFVLTNEQGAGLQELTPSLLPGTSQTLACCQTKLNDSITTPQNDEFTVSPVVASTSSCSNLSDFLALHSSCEHLSSTASMEYNMSQKLISESAKSVNFILFGASGNGKSATGNSILGGDFFKTSNQITNISDFNCHSVELDDVAISVVDCPGWNLDGDELVLEYVKRYIETAFESCNCCIDGLLFVLKFGSRFTEEQKFSIKYFKGYLGDDVMAKCGFCIFTHGDLFEKEQQKEEQPLTFTQWCESETGEIKELFRECGNRFILFNNVTKDAAVLKTQVDQLLKYRETVKRYTMEDFKRNEEMRLTFISHISRPERTKTIRRKIGSIRIRYHKWLELQETDPNCETVLNNLIQEISEIVNRIPKSEHNLLSIGKTLHQEMESKRKLRRHVHLSEQE
ncbi:protein AIG1-like isoform X2 [Biomphalaria pfeifferi]|uniref:Protein AIG1-like isoform X2 n=1 Tax=Biomphalaria pfeifferi TaxID=112525 RepID=A0AAD8B9X0_BIOPF|nr:protein AIG1-like isoform X2 [Biomphalaria pfeifferi]